jgi:hypothetical protein
MTKLARKQASRKVQPVTIVRKGIDRLDPRVRDKAMALAGGNVKRIEVVSRTEAIVR